MKVAAIIVVNTYHATHLAGLFGRDFVVVVEMRGG